MQDVKDALDKIYSKKCAYCEKKIFEHGQVEHYRPKSIYYWLAYSWDNLLLCCSACNVYKSDNFEVENERILFDIADTCKLYRKPLTEERKRLFDDLEKLFIPEYPNVNQIIQKLQ